VGSRRAKRFVAVVEERRPYSALGYDREGERVHDREDTEDRERNANVCNYVSCRGHD